MAGGGWWSNSGGSSSGGSGGSGWWGSSSSTTSAGKSASHGGGVLGALDSAAHWTSSKLGLAARDLKAAPIGVYDVVKTGAVEPWWNLVSTGHPYAHGQGQKIDNLIASTADATRHTLEHPLADPLQTLLLFNVGLHGVGSAATRAVEASRLAKAGDVVGAAKALTKNPELPPRLLKVGDERVPLPTSQAPVMRAAQAIHDKVVQRAIDNNPAGRVAGYGMRRAEGSIAETERYRARLRDVPAGKLDAAARRLTRGASHVPGLGKLQRVEQAALELTSTGTAPADAVAYHAAQAEKGVNPGLNAKVAKLYGKVLAGGYLTRDEAGRVVVDAERYPKLAAADAALARVQESGDKVLSDYGIRTPEALQARVDAPGRIRAGGSYEKPTRAKAGIPSAGLVRERQRLVSLERRYQDALTRDAAATDARRAAVARITGGSEEAARARLAELDAQHDSLVARLIPEVSPYGGRLSQAEQLRRNFENSRVGKGNRIGARKLPTVKSEEYRLAEDKLREIADRNGGDSTAQRVRALIDERDALRAALNARAEAAFAGEKPPALPGEVIGGPSVPLDSPYRERVVTLAHALEEQRARLLRLEKQAAARVKPTGIVGGETAQPGRGYVSYKTTEPARGPQAIVARGRGPVVSAAKHPVTSQPFTGEGIAQGLVPSNVTGEAAAHLRSLNRFVNTDELRQRIARTGSDTRRTAHDVLIRVPGEAAAKLSAEMKVLLGKERPTVDDEETLSRALDDYKQTLLDKRDASRDEAIGAPAPKGYRWVDDRTLGTIAEESLPRSGAGKVADWLNSIVTSATVYLKPGHVGTRILTNLATNVIQGSWAHAAGNRALWGKLSEEQRLETLAASGQHSFQAMPHAGTGAVARFAKAGTDWWARHADLAFRANSFLYEARKAGFDTPEQYGYLLEKLKDGGAGLAPEEWARMDNVAKTANRANIAYDRLSPRERRTFARYVWFYPWVKGSTMFAGHIVAEHPVKAYALGQAGVEGRQHQGSILGLLPSYEAGLLPLSGGARPLVTDFSTFSPLATPADVLSTFSVGQASSFLNPVYASLLQLLARQNQYGQHSNKPLQDALATLLAPTPESQIVTGYLNRNKDQSNRMFPQSPALAGTATPLERALGGPAVPRRLNLPAAAKAYEREKAGR